MIHLIKLYDIIFCGFFFSCPFDYITIYDGPDTMADKIGTYCGQMRNLVIFSTKNMLYVTFTTLKRTAPVQNRGFFGLFEFSESFVKLGMNQKTMPSKFSTLNIFNDKVFLLGNDHPKKIFREQNDTNKPYRKCNSKT